jgi:pyruvate/2-oxoglutarate dehydrogenase complex dihydrolipoamide acyltransferase (E2) component
MSLTKCLSKHKVDEIDQDAISDLAARLKLDGYTAQEAGREAVILHMQSLLDDRAEALSQLAEQAPGFQIPAHPVETMFAEQPAANDAAAQPQQQAEPQAEAPPTEQPAPRRIENQAPDTNPDHDTMALNAAMRNNYGDEYVDHFETAALPEQFAEAVRAIQDLFAVRIAAIKPRSGKKSEFNGARLRSNPGVL